MSMMMDELKVSEHHSNTLQEKIRDKEQEIKALKKEIARSVEPFKGNTCPRS